MAPRPASTSTVSVEDTHKADQQPQDASRAPSIKYNASGEVDESIVRAEGEDRTTLFVWGLVTAAATGGLLFGFDVSGILELLATKLTCIVTRRLESLEALSSTATSLPTSASSPSATSRRRRVLSKAASFTDRQLT